MELRDMTEEDLNGVLVCDFPFSLKLNQCRERLEEMIEEVADELGITPTVDEVVVGPDGKLVKTGKKIAVNEPCLSPFWIHMALRHREDQKIGKMGRAEYARAVSDAWKFREDQRIERIQRENEDRVREEIEKESKANASK